VIESIAKLAPRFRAKRLRTRTKVLLLLLLVVILPASAIHVWAWHHLREADRLVRQQRFVRAYPHYTQALKVWRWSASTHFVAAQTARRANLLADAKQHLAECQRLQGGPSVPLAVEHLLVRAQAGDIGEVEKALWEYIEKGRPETPLVLEAMARGYLRVLRVGTAMRCLKMLLEREPDNIEGLVLRGWVHEGRLEPQEAIKDYRRVLELAPERDDARLSLAQILAFNQPQQAHALFEQVVARQPNNLDALLGLAQTERFLGEPEKACVLLNSLLERDPNHSRALAELGAMTMTAPNGKKEAETLFRKALAADPANLEAQYQLYLCLAQQPGREPEAAEQRERYNRAEAEQLRLGQIASKEMTRKPNDVNLHYEMGKLYLTYGKPDVGLRWLYRALKLDPTHQPTHQVLYEYFKDKGEREKAEQHRAQLLSVPDDKPSARE
jgi:tetratricopeptide (TPR) repeat protein